MSTTLGNLRAGVRNEIKIDRLGKIFSDSLINNSINEAILEIQSRGDYRWSENQKSATFNTVVDTQDYALSTVASDLVTVDIVKYDNNTLGSSDFLTLNASYQEFPSGNPQNYYLYGGNIGFSPIPTEVNTVELTYRGILDSLSTDTDTSPFNVNFDKAIYLYAGYSLLATLGDSKNTQRAKIKLQRFEETIAKLYKTYLTQDSGQFQYKTVYTPRNTRTNRFANI